jgi:hypothetical protein
MELSSKRGDLANGTRLYDAISAVSHLELGDQLGRTAMVILTDGGDSPRAIAVTATSLVSTLRVVMGCCPGAGS